MHLLAFVLALGAAELPANAAVPAPLLPWVPWVLDGEQGLQCPRAQSGERTGCAYLTALSLELDDDGGRFTLRARLFDEDRVPLPGDGKRWPLAVTDARGKRVVLEQRGALPFARLPAGDHELRGRFRWDALPESIRVPESAALLSLRVRGREVERTRRPEGAQLFLDKQATEDDRAQSRLTAKVHRQLIDGVPLILETRVTLEISGEGREERLGPALPAGFVPLELRGSLPASLDDEGHLKVQARPGTHEIVLRARRSEDTVDFAPAPPTGGWPAEEVWVFASSPALRAVRVEGIAVDPTRTELPDAWRRLPAYRVTAEQGLKVHTERRGDEDTGSDQLTLRRELWLDFDGGGFTLQDHIGGTLNSGWRLEAQPSLALGRVSSSGQDQLITRLEGGGTGVEIRGRDVDVVADARFEGKPTNLPAVGWAHDFTEVNATLHMPPGWRLFHASGVDRVTQTWVRSWSPLDLFLALILPIFIWRLWGWRWGALGLLTVILVLPEAPEVIWLIPFVLVPEALLRVVPKGVIEVLLRVARTGLLIILALVALAFAMQHIREGMYPALELSGGAFSGSGGFGARGGAPPSASFAELEDLSRNRVAKKLSGKSGKKGDYNDYQQQLQVFDPKAQVQTGPGLPRWQWRQVSLAFSGPVTRDQQIGLSLLPPVVNTALAFARVLLLGLLFLCLLGLPGGFWPRALREKHPRWTVWCLPLLLGGFAGGAQAQPEPQQVQNALGNVAGELQNNLAASPAVRPALLDELKARLLRPPACAPSCATAGAAKLEALPDRLQLSLDLHASVDVEVTLPGGARGWLPERVTVDGRPAGALRIASDGTLRAALSAGAHAVVLTGPLPRAPSVQIALPLRPHHVEVSARGWRVDGVDRAGVPDETLQLTREAERAATGGDAEVALDLPSFVVVERALSLGLTWEVETTVRRLSPLGRAVVVEVPLLAGERVTSEGVRAEGGKVFVNLSPRDAETRWRSTLDRLPEIALSAPKDVPWVETWSLRAAPLWHVTMSGIPPVHTDDDTVKFWRPWPGESVKIQVVRPEGATGQTLTIDLARLELRPGRRATDATLEVELRSSRGDQHVVTLPEGAQLTGVEIDGTRQPIRQDGRAVKVPLVPGAQRVKLDWRQGDGIALLYRPPSVDLGAPSVNNELIVRPGGDRWVLFLRGPRLGPAVLAWSLLFVLVLVAIGLSRVKAAPPSMLGWVLLGIGLSQVGIVPAAFVAGWLLVLAWRKERPDVHWAVFNARQIGIAGATLIALCILIFAVGDGLLGAPEMQIRGNGSSGSYLRWTLDRATGATPSALVVSVPELVYRGAMLAWSLWLAFALFQWLREGWTIFSTGGLFRKNPTPPTPRPMPGAAVARAPDGPQAAAPEGAPVAVRPERGEDPAAGFDDERTEDVEIPERKPPEE